jgi:hypothetical protein
LFSGLLSKYIDSDKKPIISPVALSRCASWTIVLGEEYRLRKFEKRVLRRIFGPKRNEKLGV